MVIRLKRFSPREGIWLLETFGVLEAIAYLLVSFSPREGIWLLETAPRRVGC